MPVYSGQEEDKTRNDTKQCSTAILDGSTFIGQHCG